MEPQNPYDAECDLAHWRMASFTRVCQPLPDPLSAARTSASKRMVVGTLSGRAEGGRPMRARGFTAAHCASVNTDASGSDIAAAVMTASSFGVGTMVPGLSFGIAIHLSRIGLAQADDAPPIGTVRAKDTPNLAKFLASLVGSIVMFTVVIVLTITKGVNDHAHGQGFALTDLSACA